MTIEERLREALEQVWEPSEWGGDMEAFMNELSARGLAVCEVSNVSAVYDTVRREQAIDQAIEAFIARGQTMTTSEWTRQLRNAVIAADPWTKRVEQLETRLEMNFAFRDGKRISVPAGSIPDGIDCREETIRGIEDQRHKLRAEVERLRKMLEQAEIEFAFCAMHEWADRIRQALTEKQDG